jgi:hypothetical protein
MLNEPLFEGYDHNKGTQNEHFTFKSLLDDYFEWPLYLLDYLFIYYI